MGISTFRSILLVEGGDKKPVDVADEAGSCFGAAGAAFTVVTGHESGKGVEGLPQEAVALPQRAGELRGDEGPGEQEESLDGQGPVKSCFQVPAGNG